MSAYIIRESNEELYNAGSKATQDCEQILLEMGIQPVNLSIYLGKRGFWHKIKKRVQLIKLMQIKKNSSIVVQHPMYIGGIYMKLLWLLKKLKKVKLIFLVHDLESLRNGNRNSEGSLYTALDEMMFRFGDVFIIHNNKMKKYLIEERKVKEEKQVVLGIFDYLTKKGNIEREKEVEKEGWGIAIAGNLSPEKSAYIYKLRNLSLDLKFYLYGLNYYKGDTDNQNWEYQGAFPPAELPFLLKGDFGLVWDGEETESCTGNTGNYLRYNNPHKISLYIAAELPIIIWKQAALADYVLENRIGIVIEDLRELEHLKDRISKTEYFQMKKNIKPLAGKVRQGMFLRDAYKEAEQIVKG